MSGSVDDAWPVIPAYGDAALDTLGAVEGRLNIRGGDALTVFAAFCAAYDREVAAIRKDTSWGYAPRKKHGSQEWSRHARGVAVDLNVHKHPEGRRTYTDAERVAVRSLLGRFPVLRWGGDYEGFDIDEMHFEINTDPGTLRAFVLGSLGGNSMAKMVSPVAGRLSSRYGPRGGVLHAGADIATGATGVAVVAAFAGKVIRAVSGRVHDRTAGQVLNRGKRVLAKGRTPNGLIIGNPDGEAQLYGHVRPAVEEGETVAAGQIIGYVDLSGNTTGPHLHFETWTASGSTRNPEIYFRYHGIAVGSQPVVITDAPLPKPQIPPPARPDDRNTYSQHIANVQTVLARAGYDPGPADGKNGDRTRAAVRLYQSEQNRWGAANLVVDGVWGLNGPTDKWFAWTTSLQQGLNHYKGGDIAVDGDYRSVTHNRVREVQRNNRLHPDGIAGNVTTRWMRAQGTSISDRP